MLCLLFLMQQTPYKNCIDFLLQGEDIQIIKCDDDEYESIRKQKFMDIKFWTNSCFYLILFFFNC
jgi:hypothetical protein